MSVNDPSRAMVVLRPIAANRKACLIGFTANVTIKDKRLDFFIVFADVGFFDAGVSDQKVSVI